MIQYLQEMIQYSHTEVAEDDSVLTEIDDVPKLPMTYRDSPLRCTVVVVVDAGIEYLDSLEGVLKYCNFGRYSICTICIPPSADVTDAIGHVRVIERINVNLWT